jgi:ATP-binding cassette, subfamily B, bacterial PglK
MIISKNLNIFLRLLGKKEKLLFQYVVFLQLGGSILEAFGIALIIPILGIILGQDGSNLFFLRDINESLNISNRSSLLMFLVATMLLFFIFKNTVLAFIYKKIYNFAYNIQYNIKSKVYSHFIKQKYQKFTEVGSSNLISTISVDLNLFTQNFIGSLLIFTAELLVLLMISILLILIEPAGFLLMTLCALIFIFFFYKFFKNKLKEFGDEKEKNEAELQKIINDSLSSFQITKIHNKEDFFINKFNIFNHKTSSLYGKFVFLQTIPRLFLELLIIILISILILVMIKFNYTFNEIFIKIVIFSAAAFRMMPSINRLTYTYQSILFSTATLKKISMINDEILTTKNADILKEKKNKKLVNFKNSLRMENISFNYGSTKILENINLRIKKGEAIGIYGASGGGKTTLINLISGLLQPSSGKIFLDNTELEIHNAQWQKIIGYVPQSINLLNDTIINNITFCDDHLDHKLLKKISIESQISELIINEGNREVGEKGLKMSGGQLQRLSIARALYKKPEILIFDEATNALDEETEKKLLETIYSFKGKITLIIISHNLKNLDSCDAKYKLENGNFKIQS